MRCLLRTITRKGKTGTGYRDRWVEGGQITIGRGTNQHLMIGDLNVALAHACINQTGASRFQLQSLVQGGVLINGRRRQRFELELGDAVRIGNTGIKVVGFAQGDDADLVLEIHSLEPEEEESTGGLPTREVLPQTGHSKRRLAWIAFLLVLALFLALPVAGFYYTPLQQTLRTLPVPSDHSWDSGEMTSAHAFFGGDCNICHQKAFTPVNDAVCLDCHQDTESHVHTVGLQDAGSQPMACESCHREHNGADGLIVHHQRFCSDCHRAGGQAPVQRNDLLVASDFGREHPQFRVFLADSDGNGNVTTRRVAIDDPSARETSNLNFPHDIHLDPQGLEAPMGQVVLECADCHRQEPGGGLMLPVDMESHCQGCHTLELDPGYPQRQVPHGKPEEILYILSEYFARLAVEGAYWQDGQPAVTFNSTEAARAWAYDQAKQAGRRLFEDRACGQCHQVTRHQDVDGPRWEIIPARVTKAWFPHARFSHQKHVSMECADCHDAEQSTTSADVLMPGVETCRECHAGESARGRLSQSRVASSCITCHDYHVSPPEQPGLVLGVDTGVLRDRPAETEQPEQDAPRRRRPGG